VNNLLTFQNVTISYNAKPVVQDISFTLAPGRVLGIVGESGSGKSTILRSALGLLGSGAGVTAGEITYAGQSLTSLTEKKWQRLRGKEISLLFQDAAASLIPVQTVGQQLWACLRARGATDQAALCTEALVLFQRLHFSDPEKLWESYPCQLSGGMAQRVCMAMALLLQPRLLLADEPTSALDTMAQRQVVEELRALQQEQQMAMLLVTHDLGVVAALADDILVLKDGKVVEYGAAGQVLNSPGEEYTQRLLAAVPRL